MGLLIDGRWSTQAYVPDARGRFVRPQTTFREWIVADDAGARFRPGTGRYHLYASYACPWAHRTLIVRRLKGLEHVIGLSVLDPVMTDEGWHFSEGPDCIPDTVNGARYLREIYLRADAHFSGRVTTPVLWDRQHGTIVNNESREIMRMLDTAFADFCPGGPDFYPRELRDQIDATIDALYEPINNGVYRAGFAGSQQAYEEAAGELFQALDAWEQALGRRRYLCGNIITEADWCLFTTLLRFDLVYHTHFKCNLRRIGDYPNLWNYLKDLYQVPGVVSTCNLDHITQHYYRSHLLLNPRGIVPIGPQIDLNAPHDRERFG